MTQLPSGTVTFLFTDIEGSTKLAREHPDEWEIALAQSRLTRTLTIQECQEFLHVEVCPAAP